jgi:hypothetical protein
MDPMLLIQPRDSQGNILNDKRQVIREQVLL